MSNENENYKERNGQPGNRPMDVVRDGKYKISLWRCEGEERDYVSVKPAKTYTDRDGNPRDTQNFTVHDMLPLSRLCEAAYKRGRELEHELHQNRTPQQSNRDDRKVSYARNRNQRREAPRER